MIENPLTIDLDAFTNDIDRLRKHLERDTGAKDLVHFQKIEWMVWLLFLIGLATAWLGLNIFSIAALAGAGMSRWCILAHHISHRAYENIDGAPDRYQAKTFARGWHRLFHWMDWIYPEAWCLEHNVLHHYNLGEEADPDVPQDTAVWMADHGIAMPFRFLLIALIATFWKPFYYAPNTLNALRNKQEKTNIKLDYFEGFFSPLRKRFWQVLWRCWLPYILFRFLALPAAFLVISAEAGLNVLINLLVAEVIINIWTYCIIVPNHAGSDIYVFDRPSRGRGEFYLRQIVGSVDYHCGGNVRDFMHGYLNYQIEHHLFPRLTARQYQLAHRPLRDICARHGVPVVSESVFRRIVKLVKLTAGMESQPCWPGFVDKGTHKTAHQIPTDQPDKPVNTNDFHPVLS